MFHRFICHKQYLVYHAIILYPVLEICLITDSPNINKSQSCLEEHKACRSGSHFLIHYRLLSIDDYAGQMNCFRLKSFTNYNGFYTTT